MVYYQQLGFNHATSNTDGGQEVEMESESMEETLQQILYRDRLRARFKKSKRTQSAREHTSVKVATEGIFNTKYDASVRFSDESECSAKTANVSRQRENADITTVTHTVRDTSKASAGRFSHQLLLTRPHRADTAFRQRVSAASSQQR